MRTDAAFVEGFGVFPDHLAILGIDPRDAMGLVLLRTGHVQLTFEAPGGAVLNFQVESTDSLASPIKWSAEPMSAIMMTEPGKFAARLPLENSVRFYRVRSTP